VVQNAVVLWNALSLENVLQSSSSIKGLSDEDLKRILPTMTEHINFVGEFNLDFNLKHHLNSNRWWFEEYNFKKILKGIPYATITNRH
jgi:hypothetical protein